MKGEFCFASVVPRRFTSGVRTRKERAMTRRMRLAWVVAILMAATPAAQAQIPIGPGLLPTRTALAAVGLERHWMTLVPIYGAERLLSINLADNMFFAQTNMANFYAYDAES